MRCLRETARDVAERMRQIAGGVASPADAEAIYQYADWIEQHPDDEEFKEFLALTTEEAARDKSGEGTSPRPPK